MMSIQPFDMRPLKELARQLIVAGKDLCAPTYSGVLEETIAHVAPEDHGIPYPLVNQ